MESRYASNPEAVKHYDTELLRREFLVENLMTPGKIYFVYSHYDRFIIGGVVPQAKPLALPTYPQLRANYFLERREMGVINVGATGSVVVDGETFTLQNKDCLYIGKQNSY